MHWLNEPRTWEQDGNSLALTTEHGTDFWRETHYGFVHDNGHALLHPASGDFTATVAFDAEYRELYDQAGLFLLANETNWLKCGVELTSGHRNIAVVLTRDFSDWSVLELPERHEGPVTIRITRLGTTLMVDYSVDGILFTMVRLGYLPMDDAVEVGPMACAPTGQGFETRFTGFRIEAPARHDDQ
jgi:uncharacterized protein